jgi:hypothetical protein
VTADGRPLTAEAVVERGEGLGEGGDQRSTIEPGEAGVGQKCSTTGALSRMLLVGTTFALRRAANEMAVIEVIIAHAFGFGKQESFITLLIVKREP